MWMREIKTRCVYCHLLCMWIMRFFSSLYDVSWERKKQRKHTYSRCDQHYRHKSIKRILAVLMDLQSNLEYSLAGLEHLVVGLFFSRYRHWKQQFLPPKLKYAFDRVKRRSGMGLKNPEEKRFAYHLSPSPPHSSAPKNETNQLKITFSKIPKSPRKTCQLFWV